MKKPSLILALFCAATLHLNAESLLTEQPETPAQRTARELLVAPRQTRDALINQLDDASQRLWSNSDPAAVLLALGNKAARLFAINAEFGQLVGAFLTAQGDSEGLARLSAIQARTPAVTLHADGTVTIDPVAEPAPVE
jgi:hypothetical protein